MKWWVFILLPFSLLAQETHVNCDSIAPQNYQVDFDADKVYYWGISGGEITYNNGNLITIQWPNEIGTYVISAYTTRFGCEGDTSYYEVKIEDCPYLQLFIPNSFQPSVGVGNYVLTYTMAGCNTTINVVVNNGPVTGPIQHY